MKRLKTGGCLFALVGVMLWAHCATAMHYTWINGGNDNKWTNLANWQGGTGFPGAYGDIANVTMADTIHLNTNGVIMLGKLQLSGDVLKTVTLNGDAGSMLSFSGIDAPHGGFLVEDLADNRLVVGTDVDILSGVDKMGIGAIEFTGAVTSRVSSGYGFVFGNGSALFSGTSSLAAPSSKIGIGNGGWSASVLLTNQTVWRVNQLDIGVASRASTRGYLTQASADCSVNVLGSMILGERNSAGNTNAFYTLCQGALTAFEVVVGANSPAFFEQSGGALAVTNLNVIKGVYRQCGGASEFANNLLVGESGEIPRVELQGGTLLLNASITTATGGTASEQSFYFSGGTLQVPKNSSTYIPLRVSGNPVFDVLAGGGLTFRRGISGNADITGAAGLGLGGDTSAMLSGSLHISNGVFNVAIGCELSSYAGSAEPLAVTVGSGGILQLADITSNITVPMALNIESGGEIKFRFSAENHNRGLVVAHTLSTNGISLPPGRYTAEHGIVAGGSIVVPRVWTGNGDGESWNDAANWADGMVPNDATESAVLSRAKGVVRLDSAITLTCLIYNPQGFERELTLAGGGSLALSVPTTVAPALYVGPGRSLTLDVSLIRQTGSAAFAITGGGTIIIKKGFPGQELVAGRQSAFSLNGNLVFAGETAMGNTSLGLWRHERNGEGVVIFTNGCNLTCARLLNNPSGFYAARRVYHDGGDVICGDVYWTRHNYVDAAPHAYYMRSGSLSTLNNDGICLGLHYAGSWSRYPSGEFIMSGGIVNTARLAMGFPENSFDLHGGKLILGSGGIVSTSIEQGTVKLGGVELRALSNWSSELDLELSGINGAAILDTAGHTVTLNGALSGAGGLIKSGAGTLNLNGATNSFTGPFVVAGGSVVCDAISVFNGISSIIVTNGTLALSGEIVASSMDVRVSGTGSLTLPAGAELSVDRLWLGNSLQPAGTYTFGAGTITVRASTKTRWTGNAADGAKWSTLGNWDNTLSVPDGVDVALDFGYSQFDADDQIVLDIAPGVTLTNLIFDQGAPGATLTITCPANTTNTLTFSADGIIRVEEGQTLILDTDLLPAGNLYKDGLGTLVLNRRTWSDSAAAAFRLYVREGRVINRGTINALSVQPSSANLMMPPPEFTQEGDRAVMRDRVFALPGYYYGVNNKNERGVMTQTGGVVDFSTVPNWVGSVGLLIGGGGGTEGVYNLTGGELLSRAAIPAYLSGDNAMGTFNQSGGTSTLHNLTMSVNLTGNINGYGRFNLSGGTLRLSGTVLKGNSAGSVNLSGGRVETLTDEAVFAADIPVALATGAAGDVTFAQDSAAFVNTLPGILSGSGGLVQAGPGTLALTGLNLFGGGVAVSGGTLLVNTPLHNATDIYADGGHLELLAAAPALTNLSVRAAGATVRIVTDATPFGEKLTLNLVAGIVTELDFTGIVEVDTLILGGHARTPGLYGGVDSEAPEKPTSVYFTGTGALRVLNGPDPSGSIMLIK